MKSLLAALLSFVLVESQALAIHGGYTLGGTGSVTGTFAGTLIATSDVPQNGNTLTNFGTNELGIFTLNVPSTGVATGVVLIFAQGSTFFGTLEGLPDPNNSTGILGVIDATFNFTIEEPSTSIVNGTTVTTFTAVAATATAEGTFRASTSTDASTASTSSTGETLSGAATVAITQGFVLANGTPDVTETVTFDLEGFQQSTTFTSGGTLTNTSTGTTGG